MVANLAKISWHQPWASLTQPYKSKKIKPMVSNRGCAMELVWNQAIFQVCSTIVKFHFRRVSFVASRSMETWNWTNTNQGICSKPYFHTYCSHSCSSSQLPVQRLWSNSEAAPGSVAASSAKGHSRSDNAPFCRGPFQTYCFGCLRGDNYQTLQLTKHELTTTMGWDIKKKIERKSTAIWSHCPLQTINVMIGGW